MTKMHQVIAQNWLESEAGWGQRPDGFTLHLTMEDCKKFREKYWAGMPKDHVPDVYSRECGEPLPVAVDEAAFKSLQDSRRRRRYGVWGKGSSTTSGKKLKSGKDI